VEASVRWIGIERSAGTSATAGRKSQAEKHCGGPHVGQAHSAGSALKKGLKPAKRRELVREIRQAYRLNELRACGLMRITRWSNRYQSRRDPQTELPVRLGDLASKETQSWIIGSSAESALIRQIKSQEWLALAKSKFARKGHSSGFEGAPPA
jgi:hypothetical protein